MSEISKSLRGKGIFLLAAIVFSSPGRRVVRATCRTNRDAASQISHFLRFVHSKQEFKSRQVQILHLSLMFKQFDLELLNLEMYILSMFYLLHFLKEFICELRNWYHFTGG